MLTLADVSGWRVNTTNLTELQVVGVRVGNSVQVEVDALPGRVFPGEVERVADASQVVRGDVTYVATVRLLPDGVPRRGPGRPAPRHDGGGARPGALRRGGGGSASAVRPARTTAGSDGGGAQPGACPPIATAGQQFIGPLATAMQWSTF